MLLQSYQQASKADHHSSSRRSDLIQSLMPTRRSARIRTASASASASQSTANQPEDENDHAQLRARQPRKTLPTGKRSAQKQDSRQKPPQPLQDVTNNARVTRSRRLQKTVQKSSQENDGETIPAPPLKKPRRGTQTLRISASSREISPLHSPAGKTYHGSGVGNPTESKADEITPLRTRTRQSKQPSHPQKRPLQKTTTDLPNVTTRMNSEAEESLSDEIQPNPPRQSPGTIAPAPESSSDEIRPNLNITRRTESSALTPSADEIQTGPARIGKPSVIANRQSLTKPLSSPISDSSPTSPLSAKRGTRAHQTSRSDENLDPNSAAFDLQRPRQAVHTYGKRRRAARVSLPTMQALGVRAKSPSSGSQGSNEKEEDGDASEDYQESEDESEDTPKRDPKLEAFLAEQKRLWQDVDETDLLVESD